MVQVRKWVILGFSFGVILLVWAAFAYGRGRGAAQVAAAPHEETEAAVDADPGVISISPEARENIGLAVASADERVLERTLALNATLEVHPDREAFVASRVQGKVTSVKANVGDVVAAGQPLVAIQSLQIAETPPIIEVTSPLNGVVLERTVTVGETVDPTKSLIHVADLSSIIAQAEVYEADLARVRPGQTARLRVAPYPNLTFSGRVIRKSDVIDSVRRTLRIWIEVQNTPDRKLKPNMFAQVNVIVATSGRAVTVPNEAIQTDGPERFVFVQQGAGFLRQSVVLGEQDDRFTVIKTGVVAGDLVVTRGGAELKAVALRPAAAGVQDESKPHVH